MNVGTLVGYLDLDDTQFKKTLGRIPNQVADTGDDAGKKMGNGLFQGAMKFAAPLAAAFSAVAIVGFATSAIKEASSLNESANAISVTFGSAASGIMELGKAAATELGLSNVQFNQLAVRFSAFAKSIAGPGGDVVATMKEMTTRASDFASVMDLDVAQAAELFQSGLAGETEPLRKFGIDLSAAAVEAYAYANGIAATGAELTEAEKVQARYGALMEQTAATHGDFANTSGGLANGMRIFRSSLDNVQANLGTAFLPFMAMGVQALNFMMIPLKTASEGFANFGTAVGAIFTEAGGGMAGFQAVFDSVIGSVVEFFTGGGLASALEGMVAMRDQLFQGIMSAIPGIVEAIASVLPMIVTTLLGMIPVLLQSAITMFQSIVSALVTVVPILIGALTDLLPVLVTTIVGMLPSILDSAILLFTSLIEGLLEVIPLLIDAVIDLLPLLIGSLLDMLPALITSAVTLFLALVTGLAKALPQILTAIINMVPKLVTALVSMLPQLINGAITLFLGIMDAVTKALPQIIVAVVGMIPQIVVALIGAMPQLIDAGFQLLMGLARGILENAPRILAGIASSIGNLLIGGVKAIFGIKSPSRVFYGIGDMLMAGMVNGISDGQGEVMNEMNKLNRMIDVASLDGNLSSNLSVSAVPDSVRGRMDSMSSNTSNRSFTYIAAPNSSLSSEEELFMALSRPRAMAF
jgi:phage-related protein